MFYNNIYNPSSQKVGTLKNKKRNTMIYKSHKPIILFSKEHLKHIM